MPAVYVDLVLVGRRKIELKGLLNTGAEDLELVVPASVAKQLGLRGRGKAEVVFGGKRYSTDVYEISVTLAASGKKRSAKLRCISLPDELVDCVLLGTEAQAKLKVIPDTTTGKPIFK